MKTVQSSVYRAVCAIITGLLLISNPDSTVKGITVATGALFLISGAISFAAYLNAKAHAGKAEACGAGGRPPQPERPVFPIVGTGSILSGLILVTMPGAFVTSLMYILGAILILGSVNQFMTLISASKSFRLPPWFWICPSLVLMTGLFVLINPMETAAAPLLVIGWCLLFYGVTECVNAVKIHKERSRLTGRD